MSASLIHEKCRKKKEINQWAGLITLVYLSCSGWRRIRVGRNHTRATRRLFPLCQHVHETNAHVRVTIEFHNKHKCTSYRMVFFCRWLAGWLAGYASESLPCWLHLYTLHEGNFKIESSICSCMLN